MYRNIRNYYPSGFVPNESKIDRWLQGVQERTRPLVGYAKWPTAAAAAIATAATIKSQLGDSRTKIIEIADTIADRHDTLDAALADPMLARLARTNGPQMMKLIHGQIEEGFLQRELDNETKPKNAAKRVTAKPAQPAQPAKRSDPVAEWKRLTVIPRVNAADPQEQQHRANLRRFGIEELMLDADNDDSDGPDL